MNQISIFILKVLRKTYAKVFRLSPATRPVCEQDADVASQIIYDKLMEDKPCMIARFGSTEMICLLNYLAVKQSKTDILGFIRGEQKSWWWEENIISQMQMWSGFFPPKIDKIEEFCKLMLQDIPLTDILGSWLAGENYFEKELLNTKKVFLDLLNPFFSIAPWTKALENKKILVVHPFSETIKKQYAKRELLFKNHDVLPRFKLNTIKAVQSCANNSTQFADWFEALNYMKAEIDKHDYDICLIGAGAYGFPLAAHVKRRGKKAIHLGGSLQLLFGIRGKRWEDPNYGVEEWGIQYGSYTNLINEYWVRPGEGEKPENANIVEGACYW